MTTTKKAKFISRWSLAIIVDLLALYYTRSALIALVLASIAFFLTKFVMGLWTTPIDEFYDAARSGKPERIKAAIELRNAAESGDKERVTAATDALAKVIREGK